MNFPYRRYPEPFILLRLSLKVFHNRSPLVSNSCFQINLSQSLMKNRLSILLRQVRPLVINRFNSGLFLFQYISLYDLFYPNSIKSEPFILVRSRIISFYRSYFPILQMPFKVYRLSIILLFLILFRPSNIFLQILVKPL